MYLYYDKNLNLRTKIDHGEKIRQGSDFEIVLCLDNDFDFETNLNSITATIKYNGNKIGNDVISQNNDLEVFGKLYPNENTVDLIDGVYYWMYHFKFDKDPYTLNAGQITFNPTLTYVDENNVVYKTLTFGSADLFVEKTIGFGKQNINLTNNFYKDIREQLQILEAKKANKTDLADEELVVIDGKPVLLSKEFIDLINNEQLEENLDEINKLFESISNKPTELMVEVLGESGVSYRSLKNTKWTFNETIDFSGYLEKINLNFISNFQGFKSIKIEKNSGDLYVMLYDDTEAYAREVGLTSFWTNTIYKNIEIVDGDDVENIEVIAWLENNAICTSTPNDTIKYSLVLTGNTLTLVGTDGTRSSVTLNFATKKEFDLVSDAVSGNSTEITSLKERVSKIEKNGSGVDGVTSRYVVNTINDITFDGGKQDTVDFGDLIVSFKTVSDETINASQLKVGDVIYNKQLNQPDIWISEIVPATDSTPIYAEISLLEAENSDLNDYLKKNDVTYTDSLLTSGELNTDVIGTLKVNGIEYKIKTLKSSSSGGTGSGLTTEQASLINDLIIESNAGYSAGTQRMIGMVYKNVGDSIATKGSLVGLPIPSISFQQNLSSGVEIGTLTINGVKVKLYAPEINTESGTIDLSGYYTKTETDEIIMVKMSDYYTKSDTKKIIDDKINEAIYNAITGDY